MKVAFFTDTYLPHMDGVVRGILNFKAELEKRRHSVYVFAPRGGPKIKSLLPQKRHFYYSSLSLPSYPQYHAALFPYHALKDVQKHNVQIVHSHSPATLGIAALGAAKTLHLPSLFSFHTFFSSATHYVVPTKHLQGAAGSALWHYVRAYSSQFDLTTAPSTFAKEQLAQHGISSTVLPLGIDTKKFSPGARDEKLLSSLGIPKNPKLIISLGRVAQEKNLEVLLHAAPLVKKEHPDAFILIGGKGPHLGKLRHAAARLGINSYVKFPGFVPEEKIVPLYRSAHAFAFPSLFETQGLAALEALSCGTPAVGAKNSASEDIINSSNGFLCSPNAHEFAHALGRILDSPQKYRNAARKSALYFDSSKRTDSLLSLYRKLV
ncbi:D-inositol-3-phosphate glycosyltransferase [Candidatus Anstonella stagnisolia]|nr:D-inositol-3-phosphate glycosyltransferase [Candidatus Anstonella stagnisolia]